MNTHALGVIEFGAALDLVAGFASSAAGAERVRSSTPSADRQWIEREHARVSAMRSLADGDAAWHPQQIFDITQGLSRLRVEGASLAAPDLLAVRNFLRSSRLTIDSFKGDKVSPLSVAMIREEIDALIAAPKEEKALDSAIDDDANVRDEASPSLR